MVHQKGDHHSPKISIGEVGGLPGRGRAYQQTLFDGRKKTVT